MAVKKWFQDDKGNTSLLRILCLPGFILGVILCLGGLVGVFFGITESIAVIGIGGIDIIGIILGKALQKKSECSEE